MYRIIDGVLYDTAKSDFICGFNGRFSPSKKNPNYCWNYYIAKNGVIFYVNKNEITLCLEQDGFGKTEEVKRRMKPSIYKKYFELIIPGEKVKSVKQPKRLDTIE